MNTRPVLIAGAGIAGLTAAYALARKGVCVVVAERKPGFAEAGAGLQLSPNATGTLIRLGLGGEVGRYAMAPCRLDLRRWAEPRAYAGMPMQDMAETDGAPFWSMRRADLQTALLDALRMLPGVKLLVGRGIVGAVQHTDGVAATLENERGQREEIDASVLVGADGLWSTVRGLSGDRGEPRFLGYEAWRTMLPAAVVPAFARAPSVNLWLGQSGHAVHYPVDGGKLVNLVVIRNGQDASEGWSRAGDPAQLAPLAATAAGTLRDMIKAAPGWQVWSLFDRAPAAMVKGRIVLIGDAAHPVLPFLAQGASMAVEDAGVLVQVLAPALAVPCERAAIDAALATFAKVRQRRVARVQDAARSNARIYHAGFPVAQARDFMLQRLGDAGMRKRYAWLYGWRMAAGG